MNTKNVLIFTIVAVLVGLLLYFGIGNLSVIDNDKTIDIPYTCNVALDCENQLIQDNILEDYNNFRADYDLICESNKCVGVKK